MAEKLNWISVKRFLPDHGEEVLVYTKDCNYFISDLEDFDNGDRLWSHTKGRMYSEVTHWAEIEPPEDA